MSSYIPLLFCSFVVTVHAIGAKLLKNGHSQADNLSTTLLSYVRLMND